MNTSRRGKALWAVGAVLIIAYALVPVLWIFSLSFKGGDDITNNQFFPTDWSLENYRIVLSSDLFLSALRNSVGISIIATTVSVVIATLAAYAVARLEFPGKRILLGSALAITVFPIIAIATPLFNLWRTIGLYDTWIGRRCQVVGASAAASSSASFSAGVAQPRVCRGRSLSSAATASR